MRNLQKFIIFSLCLLCWHCSCDSKSSEEISTKQPLDNEASILHNVQNAPVTQEPNLHQDVNNQKIESEQIDQNIAKEMKHHDKKKLLHHIDVRIAKYKEQLRKMRRRSFLSSIVNKIISKPSISDTVNIATKEDKSALENVSQTTAQEIPVDISDNKIEMPKETPEVSSSYQTSESQETSQESAAEGKVVQKPSSSEAPELRESSDSSQHSHSDAMPSFDEWKKMMLAEQEKGGHKIPSINPPGKKITSQKRHRNYASYECGAKIVASNSEAEGTSRILNERLDEYMLNPCKAKAWFVIEMCETVQVSQIELANFELFSSCPKDFTVSFSDSFPTRDWVPAGIFTAAEQRILQSFQAKSEGFIKFIKVELLSHYGKEHYCPLNVVRVFGTSMVDEYEEMEKMSDHHTSSDDELDRLDIPVEDKSSSNIFGSATNAVYNMVKKAAQVLGHNAPVDESSETTGEHNASSKSKHCNLVDDRCIVEGNKSVVESNISDSQDLPNAIHSSLYNQLQHCDQCLSFSNQLHYSNAPLPQCRFFQAAFGPVNFKSICDWLKAHYLLPFEQSEPTDTPQNHTGVEEKKPTPPPPVISVIIDSKSRGQAMPSYSDMIPSSSTEEALPQKTIQLPPNSQIVNEESKSTEEKIKLDIQPTKTLPVIKDAVYTDLLDTSKMQVSTDKDPSLDASVAAKKDDKIMPSMQVSLKSEDSHSPTSSIPSHTEAVSQNLTKKSDHDEKIKKSDEKLEFNEDDQLTMELANNNIDITTEPSVKDFSIDPKIGSDIKFDSKDSTVKVDPVIVGGATFSAAQKESVFVRMNNRIKALELNMSLSSQYLQELSQRYRRQMEEMQRAFNRTIGTLNDTARKAAERDLKQQEIIGNLQSQLSNLTLSVDEITKKHVLLMVAETIIMVTIMSLCVRRISSFPQHTVPHVVTVPGNVARPSRSDMKRRNSAGSCSPPSLKRIKKRSSSDEALHSDEVLIVEPSSPIIIEPPPKIKKRKKKKHMKRSSSNPVTSPRKCSSASLKKLLISDKTCTAGLLFTHISYEKDNAHHSCENCYNTTSSSNCDSVLNPSIEKRLNSIPLKNLTNGDLNQHSLQTVATKHDKFSFRKFLRFQKRESI